MYRRPHSATSLILIAFSVVLGPLIVVVTTAVVQIERLAEESRVIAPETLEHLGELEGGERAIYKESAGTISGAQAAASPPAGLQPWERLDDVARRLLDGSASLTASRGNTITQRAAALQRTLVAQAAAAIPASVALGALLIVLVTRPMRQIGAAIRRLGAQDFSRSIDIRGSSDVEELGSALERLRLRIIELEQQKLTFLRHMSHELKTPLTTIREGADLLAESLPVTAPEEVDISRIIRANSLHLQNLIEDLLRFSETQDFNDLQVAESVQLEALVREVAAAQTLAAEAKSLDVAIATVPVRIRADEHKVRSVIDNLLSNAIRFTPSRGRIAVSLSSGDGYAIIDVRDNGPGIHEADAERIFEPFQQGDVPYEASVAGTGLGLSIAKVYAETHDGYVKLMKSASGAHFRAAFPIAGPAPLSAKTKTMRGPHTGPSSSAPSAPALATKRAGRGLRRFIARPG